jgi:hypothetical protein
MPAVTVFVVDDEEPVRETLVSYQHPRLSRHHRRQCGTQRKQQHLDVEGIHLVIADIHLTPGTRYGRVALAQLGARASGLPSFL